MDSAELWKLSRAAELIKFTAVTQATAIIATITAYSTAVVPSSSQIQFNELDRIRPNVSGLTAPNDRSRNAYWNIVVEDMARFETFVGVGERGQRSAEAPSE